MSRDRTHKQAGQADADPPALSEAGEVARRDLFTRAGPVGKTTRLASTLLSCHPARHTFSILFCSRDFVRAGIQSLG